MKTRRRLVIVGILISVVCAVGIGLIVFNLSKNRPSALLDTANRASFTVYEPSYLPAGYSVDKKSIELRDTILIFRASNKSGGSLIFTETPTPPGYDYRSFYEKQFVGPKDVASNFGQARIGTVENRSTGSLFANDTWTLVRGASSFSAVDMSRVVQGLSPVRSPH